MIDHSDRLLVLVIEDDLHDWEIYGKILWYNGFDVLYAADGEAGAGLARKHAPDLVLLDLMLPGINGLEVCRRLSADPLTARIPIVLLSGRPAADFEAAAREAGAECYLEKPVGPVAVLHTVERLIGRPPPAGVGRPPRIEAA
jgi:DNA-binding response OmpR family regulator